MRCTAAALWSGLMLKVPDDLSIPEFLRRGTTPFISPAIPTASVLHRDIETRSRGILRKVGAHRYAADPSTEVLCVAYAVDDGPVQLWIPGDPVPPEFIEAARNPSWIVAAHNDAFESAIEQHVLHPRYDWPIVPPERHVCTMAMALAAGLPARLSAAADALELSFRKDTAGERLMHLTSKPRRPHKDEDPKQIYWFEDPERLNRLYSYCERDTEVERELYDRLPSLSPTEQALWILSSKINTRGFYVDRKFAEAARRIAQAAAPEIDAELSEITDGAVTGINQVARLLQWLQQQGCTAKNLNRKAIEKLLLDDLPPQVLRALELRLAVHRQQPRRSLHCLPELATMIVSVAPSVIMVLRLVVGLAKDSNRRT
jgi:DNA polymerase bacteriophage-type